MNGSEALIHTLLKSGVDTCFANPGTSEMHFVAALDRIDGIRCVLALFEGVATGAADGYYRMSEKPACTLLHLGPGLANGLANLHNAKKARSGIVNIVGEHATYHVALDAPLTSDIEGVARPMSDWVRTSRSTADVASDGAAAVAAAKTGAGSVATLILPADVSWQQGGAVAEPVRPAMRATPDAGQVVAAARALSRGERSLLLLGGGALHGEALRRAGRIAARTGCRLMSENLNARMERGAGKVLVDRLPYVVDAAIKALSGFEHIVAVGAKPPIAFFAYPDKPSVLSAAGCEVIALAKADDDIGSALASLEAELDAANATPNVASPAAVGPSPTGPNTPAGIAQVLAALMPEDAVVVDESITTGRLFGPALSFARPHDCLNSMGGSIGFGLPLALGASLAAPARRVIALEGDGSAMYTPQALWTMAREGLPVIVLVFANRSYEILKNEFAAVRAGARGVQATSMLSIDRPTMSWAGLAKSLGVDSGVATDLSGLALQFQRGLDSNGPYLIEVMM
jgi:acetolactate synthase-1/2/3 large subunit